MIHTLSIESFNTLTDKKAQETQLFRLYARMGAMSDREASRLTGWNPSHVSARRNGLVKRGRVVELGRKKDVSTGRMVASWGLLRETLAL
jgi:hypothetical protein